MARTTWSLRPSEEDMIALQRFTMTGLYEDEEYVDHDARTHTSDSHASSSHDHDLYDSEDSAVTAPTQVRFKPIQVRFRGISGHEILARGMNEQRRIMTGEVDYNDRLHLLELEELDKRSMGSLRRNYGEQGA